MADELDPDALVELLTGERRQWEQFGVVPGADSVNLIVDRYAELALTTLDRAFLFVCLALVVSGEIEDDDERANLEFALADIGDALFEEADTEPMGPVLGVAKMRLVTTSRLSHVDDTVAHVARVDAGVGPEPTLYTLVTNPKRCVEVVVKPGKCRVAAFSDPSEAIASLSNWVI